MIEQKPPANDRTPLTDARDVSAQPPIDLGLTLRGVPTGATGFPAVLHSFEQGLRHAGPVNTVRTFLSVNQRDGYDCPSCAWADPEGHRSLVEFCENGAKALADATTKTTIGREFFARYSIAELSRESDQWLNEQGRLCEPMLLEAGATHYTPISWDDAFALVGDTLRALPNPNRAVFYTSGKASNEAAFLYQLFVRLYGTNNMPDCSNMCHESSGAAIGASLGVGKATVTLHDLEHAKLILIFGQNPGTNHPRMLTSLQKAKRAGATIVSINPMPEVGLFDFRNPQEPAGMLGIGTKLTDHFLQVRINGDAALLQGILKAMFAREERAAQSTFDWDFIREYTHGFDDLARHIAAADWNTIEEQSGISRSKIEEIAELIGDAENIVACWAMGLTQQPNAVAIIRELINVLMLTGNIGETSGGGLFPVRGHSNVQGDRTMGIWEKMPKAFLDRLGAEFDFEPPREDGYDVVEAIHAMHDGKIDAYVSLGGNLLAAAPDTEFVAQAMSRVKFTAYISTKLNRGHLACGQTSLILPCLSRTERDEQASGRQFVTVENTVSVVSRSSGNIPPVAPNLKSEPAIIAGIAKATVAGKGNVDWDAMIANYDVIRDHVSHICEKFENFNERIRRDDEIFYAPVPAKHREFRTPTGKANFAVNALPAFTLEEGQYVMMTVRTHDQFNTVVYGPDDRYRGIIGGRRVIFMNADDIAEAGLQPRQLVDITSHFRGQTRTVHKFAVIPYDIPRRSTATYFPETNPLVPIDSTAEISNTPTSKYVVITVAPSQAA